MTGQGTTSYGGVPYTKYTYAGLYTPRDFHQHSAGECPTAEGNIDDFNDYRRSSSANWSACPTCAPRRRRCAARSPAT